MAKTSSILQKREIKKQRLVERTVAILKVDEAMAEGFLSTPLQQSVRINPLGGDPQLTLAAMRALGWKGEPVDWCTYGYTLEQGFEALRDSELVTDGKIYIQNSSSWLPVIALEPRGGERVLDVCAAPGGKTSHLAALMNNTGVLVANDNSRARLAKLQANLARLHVVAECTLYDASRLASVMEERRFDKILIDAPCSGEGLINLNVPKSLDSWSVAHIRRLATLQKRLLYQAWQLLEPDGTLVYSTCTMAPEEDEAVIDWLLTRTEDATTLTLDVPGEPAVMEWNNRKFHSGVQNARRIIPGKGDEAFFVCKLKKSYTENNNYKDLHAARD
jgi:tRNA (cytosine49-C5)-methyltransferase